MSDLRATRPEEADGIRVFLARVFRAPQESPAWSRQVLSWKYYEPRPDWEGSRSYVLEAEGGYASHGCVWPVTFASASKEIRAAQVIDWAADPAMPGAGVLLRRRVQDLAPVSLAIGGSDATRKVLPRVGYATRGMYRTFVRVVRPFRQFLQRHDGPLWKRLARTARNTAWSFASMPEEETVWRAEPVDRFEDSDTAQFGFDFDFLAPRRTAELLNYLLRCPAAGMKGYRLTRADRLMGTLLLSQLGGQTRLADVQVHSGDPEDWYGAASAATHTAAKLRETCEIAAHSSLELLSAALSACGYRERYDQPVFVSDPEEILPELPLHVTPVDYDDFFAFDPSFPFAS